MKRYLETVLKEFVATRNDLFESKSVFVRFECDSANTQDDSAECTSSFLCGRIRYSCENGDQVLSPPLFLKLMPTNGKFAEGLPVLFGNEMFFYGHILPFFTSLDVSVSTLFPKFYEGHTKTRSRVTEALMILEHLGGSYYKNTSRNAFLDYSHLSLMARRLGKFHAYSYLAKELDPEHFFAHAYVLNPVHFTTLGKMRGFLTRIGYRGLDRLALQDKYKNSVPAVQHLLDNADRLLVEMFKGQRYNKLGVVCHGDYVPGNILFLYDGQHPVDLKMIDMAYSTFSSPVLDLALVLYINADQKTRDVYWNQLIDDYCDGLSSLSIPIKCLPSKNDILSEFSTSAFYAYLVASYFLPHLLSKDFNMETFQQLMPTEYANLPLDEIPVEVLHTVITKVGGEIGTKALADILKDMLKRGFIKYSNAKCD